MFKSKILGALLGFVAVCGIAVGANTFYAGFNPQTNAFGINGVQTAGGPTPTSGASTSCGTLGAITGGTSTGSIVTAAVTTCTLQLVLPVSTLVVSGGANSSAAPNGVVCTFVNLTHPAAILTASMTTTSCTSAAATITAGDTIQYHIEAY